MITRIFTCASCKGTFASGITDDEAMQAYKQQFGTAAPTDHIVPICDDCFVQFMKWYAVHGEPNPSPKDPKPEC